MPYMHIYERELTGDVRGTLLTPANPLGAGMVVLGGSSGVVPVERASLLAQAGIKAVAVQWFGGPDQSPGICEIPLETFTAAIDLLQAEGCSQIGILGTSKGAEAALLVGAVDVRVAGVFAFSPTSVVWANAGPGLDGYGWPLRSSFTWGGKPFAFVPHRAEALLSLPQVPPIKYLDFHRGSLADFPASIKPAEIPVEQIEGRVVLIAGEDDQLWPSAQFARDLEARAQACNIQVVMLTHPSAGHRILIPGETTPKSKLNVHGGSDEADSQLGAAAWAEILKWAG